MTKNNLNFNFILTSAFMLNLFEIYFSELLTPVFTAVKETYGSYWF